MLIHKVIHDGGLSRPLAARCFRPRAGLGSARAGVIPRVVDITRGARTSPRRQAKRLPDRGPVFVLGGLETARDRGRAKG